MRKHWKAWVAIGVLVLLTPIGLIATEAAWGEWSTEEVQSQIGFVPGGMETFSNFWKSPFPDYAFGEGGGTTETVIAYVVSAVVGVAATALFAWLLTKWLAKKEAAENS